MTVLFFCLSFAYVLISSDNAKIQMMTINNKSFWVERNMQRGEYRMCAPDSAKNKNVIPERMMVRCDKWHRPYQFD